MRTLAARWPVFKRVEKQSARLDLMMEFAGADKRRAVALKDGAAFRSARENCINCVHDHTCQNWLESSAQLSLPPDFCPNYSFLRGICAPEDALPKNEQKNGLLDVA